MGIRIADPKPAFCSNCHQAQPDQRYIDFGAAHDSGCFTSDLGVYNVGQDDLFLCESCIRDAAEILDFKPEREAAQRREIQRLTREVSHWRDSANRGLRDLNETIGSTMEPKRRKVAV